MRLVRIDLDGSLPSQAAIPSGPDWNGAHSVDMRKWGPGMRIVATRRSVRRFIERLGPVSDVPEVIFYGSGDFHHLSAALLARLDRPVTVIHFDNHPDWTAFPPTFNCGGWVARALALPHVERVITIGPCSDDFVWPEAKLAGLGAIRRGRHDIYPWSRPPSFVLGRYGDGPGRRQTGRHLHWRSLADEDWPEFLDGLIAKLPATRLYITVDKDVLRPREARTNWDQGRMSLQALTLALERLAGARAIVGVDVCGDYSPAVFSDVFRRTLAYVDHPRLPAVTAPDLAVNARTNAALISSFRRLLG
jgi:hypothetical protein